jgi:hypothetical protein
MTRAAPPRQKPLILCFSHLRWDFVWQRPQQLLSRAASAYDVVYVEEPVVSADAAPPLVMQTPLPGLQVVQLHVGPDTSVAQAQAELARQVQTLVPPGRDVLLWYYTPMALPIGRSFKARFSLYDCMDDLASFRHAPASMRQNEELLMKCVDLVLTGGLSLHESRRDRHPNVHLFPSSVDAAHFCRARMPSVDPPDQRAIPRPRIGYFGVIDERIDLGLVADLAAMRPHWHFVLLGPTAKIDPASRPTAPNIHWLGIKRYAELPVYLQGWSAGFMPFARNDATRYISPTKTPEFLAAGLPLVSTPIADVQAMYSDLVSFAASAEPFAAALETAMKQRTPEWLAEVDAKLSGQSWDDTWSRIESLLLLPPPTPSRPAIAHAVAHV